MRQSIIFILYLLCTFTARSQSALTPEQTGSIYYAYPVSFITYTPAPLVMSLLRSKFTPSGDV